MLPDERHLAGLELAMERDEAYFAEHPRERAYVRRPIEHETCLPGVPCRAPVLIGVTRHGSRCELSGLGGPRRGWETGGEWGW